MRVAILLAAGASRRMGRTKLTLEIGGMTLVERSLRSLLRAGVDLVRIVVAPGFVADFAERGLDDTAVELVVNSDRDVGLSSSIRAGLRGIPAGCTVILVSLADKPLVRESTIRALIDAFEGCEARVVYPLFGGEQGHPVLFDAALAEELSGVEADRGARLVIERHRAEARGIVVEDPGVCLDIDTPEDYAEVQRLFESDQR